MSMRARLTRPIHSRVVDHVAIRPEDPYGEPMLGEHLLRAITENA